MVAEIYRRNHARTARSHGSANELEPICVVELKHIVMHDQVDGFQNHSGWESLGELMGMQLKPSLEHVQAVVRVNVGAHCHGICSDYDSGRWELT